MHADGSGGTKEASATGPQQGRESALGGSRQQGCNRAARAGVSFVTVIRASRVDVHINDDCLVIAERLMLGEVQPLPATQLSIAWYQTDGTLAGEGTLLVSHAIPSIEVDFWSERCISTFVQNGTVLKKIGMCPTGKTFQRSAKVVPIIYQGNWLLLSCDELSQLYVHLADMLVQLLPDIKERSHAYLCTISGWKLRGRISDRPDVMQLVIGRYQAQATQGCEGLRSA